MSPEPGWYPDPDDETTIRFWDGVTWADVRVWDGARWTEVPPPPPPGAGDVGEEEVLPPPPPGAGDVGEEEVLPPPPPGAGDVGEEEVLPPPPPAPWVPAATHDSTTPVAVARPVDTGGPRRVNPWLVALLAVLAGALSSGIVYLLTRSDDTTTSAEVGPAPSGADDASTTSPSTDAPATSAPSTTAPSTTTPPTTSPPTGRPVVPAAIRAESTAPPGFDSAGAAVPFDAGRMIDDDPATAWRTVGDASGQRLTITLPGRTRVLEVGLIPGYSKTDPHDGTNWFPRNRRVRRVRWDLGGESVEQTFAARPQMQRVDVDATATTIVVEILDTTEPGDRDYTPISEIEIVGVPQGDTATPSSFGDVPAGPEVSIGHVFPIQPASAASYGRSHHDYPATDAFAPCGTTVVAPADGRITELRRDDPWEPATNDPGLRGGRVFTLVGDDGVRYYAAHLGEVAVDVEIGDHVAAGRVLGTVGDSGNARGIDCHLHFGISPPCDGYEWSVRRGAVYPWPYLDAWKAGRNDSPADEVRRWAADHPGACAQAQADAGDPR